MTQVQFLSIILTFWIWWAGAKSSGFRLIPQILKAFDSGKWRWNFGWENSLPFTDNSCSTSYLEIVEQLIVLLTLPGLAGSEKNKSISEKKTTYNNYFMLVWAERTVTLTAVGREIQTGSSAMMLKVALF